MSANNTRKKAAKTATTKEASGKKGVEPKKAAPKSVAKPAKATAKPVKAAANKPAPKKTAAKKATTKNVRPAPRLEDTTAPKKKAQKHAPPSFSMYDEVTKKFIPVEGAKSIAIPGLDDFKLFVHQTKDGRTWCVSEASSGGRLAVGSKRSVAVQMATEMLNKHGKSGILEGVQRSINRTGVAPGFTLPGGIHPPDGIRLPEGVKIEEPKPKQIFKVTTDDGKKIEVTYTPGFMQHLEFRGEISSTGYHSHFGYKGELANVQEAARIKANELRATFLKEQAKQARKEKSPQVTTRLKSQILAVLVDDKKLPREQVHFDEIVKQTGAEISNVAATLMVLELSGKVKSLPGKNYRMPTAEEQSAAKPKPAKTSGESCGSPAGCNRGGKPRGKMGLLDAAAEILKDAKEPLCCKDIIRAVFEKKMAESGGRTPQATLSAAIGREIFTRGNDSRFKRVGRWQYAANS